MIKFRNYRYTLGIRCTKKDNVRQTLSYQSHLTGLNRRPHPYHGCALPTELKRRVI